MAEPSRAPALRGIGMIAPALLFITAFFLLPLALMGYVSVLEKGRFGGVEWGVLTYESYVRFLFERDFLDDSLVINTDY
ncbi:MAG TPA: ABC transporter permease, partial [Alphaproteobacteria bacterium]|nr:ABC transporter permease [Alphaproteobacteria bacterium]